VFVVNARVTSNAEDTLRRGLEDAGALLGDWQATLSDNFQIASRLIADSPKLKAAIDTGDPQTVAPLARQYRAETKADVLIITDRQGKPLSMLGRFTAHAPPPQPDVEAGEGRASVSYWPHADGMLEVVTVPVVVGSQRLGAVSVGFVFDRQRALQLGQMMESEIAFAIRGQVRAATLAPDSFPVVATILRHDGTSQVVIGGEEFIGLVKPFANSAVAPGDAGRGAHGQSTAEGTPGGEEPAVIVLQSRTERLRFLREIHAALGVTALLAVIVAIGLSYMVARTVTRPLAALTDGMREMARTGDLTRKVTLPAGNWEDEDARLLATTFNTLTDSIATFQREAAQRERLSSLGRLSTVIAHEIRNPLMIIKASLRTLRREPLEANEVREACGDIGEEVERLNRIVAGVLDFARPIRFELAPTDVRAVCQQSIAAATADGQPPAVRLDAPPGVPTLNSDAERLRGVLVNLLTNARQAVIARREMQAAVGAAGVEARAAEGAVGGPGPPALGTDAEGPPDVELGIEVLEPNRVALEVRDRGAGIPQAEISRIFEPYFTTKRGGTGLGLAIARNVIEGLGGSISIQSNEGVGTRVRIELTDAG
jgi:signal transduction histidine kinase